MSVFVPEYYKKFKCIADKCRHSCCRGWDIGIGDDIIRAHELSTHPLSRELLRAVRRDEDGAWIEAPCGICPFLDSRGLCRIISEMGDAYLSDICRHHPRFFHRVCDRYEAGIGASCEEAARIMLSSDNYSSFISIDTEERAARETDHDTLRERAAMYEILATCRPHTEKLEAILMRCGASRDIFESEEIAAAIAECVLLDESHRELLRFGMSCEPEMEKYSERFLAYLIFRHLTPAEDAAQLRANAAFAVLLTLMLESSMTHLGARTLDDAADIARIISEEIEYCEDNADSLKMAIYLEMI